MTVVCNTEVEICQRHVRLMTKYMVTNQTFSKQLTKMTRYIWLMH